MKHDVAFRFMFALWDGLGDPNAMVRYCKS